MLDVLSRLHTTFYEAYDRHVLTSATVVTSTKGKTRPPAAQNVHEVSPAPLADVRVILPAMRVHVLAGLTMAFSSLVPLGTDPKLNEFWRMADWFGGKVSDTLEYQVEDADVYEDGREPVDEIRARSLNSSGKPTGFKRWKKVDCLVAGKRGTAKVGDAKRMGVPVVTKEWLLDSVYHYKRQKYEPYFLEPNDGDSVPVTEAEEVSSLHTQPVIPLDILAHSSRSIRPPSPDPDDALLNTSTDHVFDTIMSKEDWADMDAEVDAELEDDDEEDPATMVATLPDRESTSQGNSKRPRKDDDSPNEDKSAKKVRHSGRSTGNEFEGRLPGSKVSFSTGMGFFRNSKPSNEPSREDDLSSDSDHSRSSLNRYGKHRSKDDLLSETDSLDEFARQIEDELIDL
ncbi:Carboxy-terminal domain (CTD) phosphatase [Gonapodya sp. JEL0774]|nr:Carboxy-terminal domain (CTD) phosphatase [Gonapodya sp. JEL0774]